MIFTGSNSCPTPDDELAISMVKKDFFQDLESYVETSTPQPPAPPAAAQRSNSRGRQRVSKAKFDQVQEENEQLRADLERLKATGAGARQDVPGLAQATTGAARQDVLHNSLALVEGEGEGEPEPEKSADKFSPDAYPADDVAAGPGPASSAGAETTTVTVSKPRHRGSKSRGSLQHQQAGVASSAAGERTNASENQLVGAPVACVAPPQGVPVEASRCSFLGGGCCRRNSNRRG